MKKNATCLLVAAVLVFLGTVVITVVITRNFDEPPTIVQASIGEQEDGQIGTEDSQYMAKTMADNPASGYIPDYEAVYKTHFNGKIYTGSEMVERYPYASMNYLLGFHDNCVILGGDCSAMQYSGAGQTTLYPGWGILKEVPDAIMRERSDGSRYMVIDSDDGCRWFFIMAHDSQKAGSPIIVGFPLLLKKDNVLRYADFKGIAVGDTLADVEAIDELCSYYRSCWFETYHLGEADFNGQRTIGMMPYSTLHYLEDGLLRIGYGSLDDNGEPVICEIEYCHDYKMGNMVRKMLDYSLNPLDLP